MAEWFRRQSAKIKTKDRKEIAEGTWLKCPQCHFRDVRQNQRRPLF